MYYSVNFTTGTPVSSEDSNGITIYTVPLDENFVTSAVSSGRNVDSDFALHITSAITGAGTLTLQYSQDGITWYTEVDAGGTDITFTVDNTDNLYRVKIINTNERYYRFSYDAGTVSAGNGKVLFSSGG